MASYGSSASGSSRKNTGSIKSYSSALNSSREHPSERGGTSTSTTKKNTSSSSVSGAGVKASSTTTGNAGRGTSGSGSSKNNTSSYGQLENAVSTGKKATGSYNGIPASKVISVGPNVAKDPIKHDYSRNQALAGQVAIQNDMAVYYDDNGYMTKAVKLSGSGGQQAIADLNRNGIYTGRQQTAMDLTGSYSGLDKYTGLDEYGGNWMGNYQGKNGAVTPPSVTNNYNGAYGTAGRAPSGAYAAQNAGQTTATLPNGQKVGVSYLNGKVQDNLPVGTVIHTAGGDYQITGGAAGNYTSSRVNGGAASGYGTGSDALSQLINSYYNIGAARSAGSGYDFGSASSESTPWLGTGLMDYNTFLESGGYNAAADSIRAANDSYLAQLEAQAERQRGQVSDQYDDAARQAYINYMQSKRTLPQRMSASGMAGGLADSQEIALDAQLQNDQTDLNIRRQAALQELQAALMNDRLSASQNYMGNLAALQQQAAGNYQNYALNQQSLYNDNYWNLQNMELQKQQMANSLAQQEVENQRQAWGTAMQLWEMNGYATEDVAAVLGVPVGAQTDSSAYREAQIQLAMLGL